jgi:iron complex outermembrane recepter protein
LKKFKKTAIAVGVTQFVLMTSGFAFAQTAPAANSGSSGGADSSVVVVTGQRASLESAQKIKQSSDEVVDSIVADDIGKLPDRSVTEVLQRIVGVTIDRTMAKGDPEHYSVEGSGVTIRGLSYVRSELNGRDSFSANGGRSLNFEDVPPELMAGVDVYKNPSAEQIEGGISGLVNLRTAMPFDYKDRKFSFSAQDTYSKLKKGKAQPSYSLLFSDRLKTDIGEFGALFDLATSKSGTRTDAFQVEPYYPRPDIVNGQTVWVPKGSQWRTLEFDRKRDGAYAAFQWKLNDQLQSSLSYFKSRYTMKWDEQAIFSGASPYNIQVANGVYDAKGALLSGVLSDPTDGGINFNDDTRTSTRHSDTTDISWNVKWRLNNQWTVTTDLQKIRATTGSFDSTIATGLQIPKEQVDLSSNPVRLIFDQSDLAYLANPNNYYWAFTMEHQDQSVANEKAWKTDVKYEFDHPILRDLRFGMRLTDRDATTTNSSPGYNWAAITQPWQVGWNIPHLAMLGDPRFSGGTHLNSFTNFYSGGASVPAIVVPDSALANGWPDSYAALHKYHDILCAEQAAAQGWGSCDPWKPATFGTDPSGVNDQREKTQALYTQLRFGFDDLKYPVDGNIGVRYVKTNMTAHGYTVFSPNVSTPDGYTVQGQPIPTIPAFSQKADFDNSYNNVLPTLNLRMKASDKLQFRFAYGTAMARPDFSQLQAYTSLSESIDTTNNATTKVLTVNNVNLTGSGNGNPMLKPTTAKQTDLTAEWYFAPAGSLTFATFHKKLHDIIINQSFNFALPDVNGTMHDFTTTGPVNGAEGTAKGFELAYQQYFDKLPGWMSGFGLQANYTYVDSHQDLYHPVYQAYCSGGNSASNLNLNLNGCDVDGKTFANLPLNGLSRNAYNLALLYDKGPISARIAYSWRSKALQAVNANGTSGGDGTDTNPNSPTFGQHNVAWALPTWSDDYGQVDAALFYKINDRLTVGIEAQNLTDSEYRQLMQQGIGFKTRAWFKSGPRYTAQMRYTF